MSARDWIDVGFDVFFFACALTSFGAFMYGRGQRSMLAHCRSMLNESHLSAALALGSVKEQLRPWLRPEARS